MNTYTKDTERFLTVSSWVAFTIIGAWAGYLIGQAIRIYLYYPLF